MIAVLLTVALSAAGVGLVLPVLPRLLGEFGAIDGAGWLYGGFLALYAGLQFVFAPILGSLSDRFGRRKVLLFSLAGVALDSAVMATAPFLWLLFVGRALAGVTNATISVASAYVTDVTPEPQRARRFGQLNAAFGVGFIAGPALGGLLGDISPRAPFAAAAILQVATLILAALTIREPDRAVAPTSAVTLALWNPVAPVFWALSFPRLRPMLAVYLALALVGEVGAVIWVLYGQDRFQWTPFVVGLSLAGFGLFHALSQAFIAGPVAERWGERRAVLIGILTDAAAYVALALTSNGLTAFLLLPLFCIGGIGAPALQAMISAGFSDDEQGRLQGTLASLTSLASVIGPFAISLIYFASRDTLPGLVWLLGAGLSLLCIPAFIARRGIRRSPTP